jgi:hypothetical protein
MTRTKKKTTAPVPDTDKLSILDRALFNEPVDFPLTKGQFCVIAVLVQSAYASLTGHETAALLSWNSAIDTACFLGQDEFERLVARCIATLKTDFPAGNIIPIVISQKNQQASTEPLTSRDTSKEM